MRQEFTDQAKNRKNKKEKRKEKLLGMSHGEQAFALTPPSKAISHATGLLKLEIQHNFPKTRNKYMQYICVQCPHNIIYQQTIIPNDNALRMVQTTK